MRQGVTYGLYALKCPRRERLLADARSNSAPIAMFSVECVCMPMQFGLPFVVNTILVGGTWEQTHTSCQRIRGLDIAIIDIRARIIILRSFRYRNWKIRIIVLCNLGTKNFRKIDFSPFCFHFSGYTYTTLLLIINSRISSPPLLL